jgi:predicted amidohydrolase
MRVAAISFEVRAEGSSLYDKLEAMIAGAAGQGARLIVLPELVVLGAYSGSIAALARQADGFQHRLGELSKRLDVMIVGGSCIEQYRTGMRNVCPVALPDGSIERVEKHVLTQWEKHEWGLEAGAAPTPVCDVGVLICYDSEFPELARPLAQAGARILCVPSFTETRHGFQRVRWSCLARAIENQVFVIHASLTGDLGGEPVPSTYGSSAIIAPSVPPFPESAILAETVLNEPGIAIAELDFAALEEARNSGDVRNWNDYLEAF